MRLGLAVPQYGTFADPAAIVEVAQTAESLRFDSLWVGDAILNPLRPRSRYLGPGGVRPAQFATFLDPIGVLTVAATVTQRVRLGTSTLNAPWYAPVLLARSLSTLDHLSNGRLDVGLGLGWSKDEYQSVAVPWRARGDRLDETLDLLMAVWTEDVVQHNGHRWQVPPSHVEPKPVQRPHPPVLLAGLVPASLARVGRRADGWLAVGLPLPRLAAMWQHVVRHAEQAGRDPVGLRMSVRVNPVVTPAPAASEQVPHRGTVAQISEYLLGAVEQGADEVIVDLQQTVETTADLLALAEQFRDELRGDL